MLLRYDFVTVGSGLAGLTFALKCAEKGRVAVLTKADVTESNTHYAQGGIAAAIDDSDSIELHEEDTLRAGGYLNDRDAVRYLVEQAPSAIGWLASMGARFDSDGQDYDLNREGGHSRNRIVHHADVTGWEVERAMSEAVRAHPNVDVFENAFVTDLALNRNRCVGARAWLGDAGDALFLAKATMLATGGAGKLYQHTTNPRIATADGIGLGIRAGADVADLEFMQFHPTTLHHEQRMGFLLTEALRGAGATLRTHRGRRFMYDYDDRLELAPRDVVARAIVAEMARLDTWCMYLDATHLDRRMLEAEFPNLWGQLRQVGIELERDWIPVVPAQHYACGGLVTDLDGRTTLAGLYAAGEVARTGVHGANRLASNSLVEAVVFARAAAEVAGELDTPSHAEDAAPFATISEADAIRIRHALQRTMTRHLNVVRSDAGMREASARIEELQRSHDESAVASFSTYAAETRNLLSAARAMIDGALARRENVGLHHNADLVNVSG